MLFSKQKLQTYCIILIYTFNSKSQNYNIWNTVIYCYAYLTILRTNHQHFDTIQYFINIVNFNNEKQSLYPVILHVYYTHFHPLQTFSSESKDINIHINWLKDNVHTLAFMDVCLIPELEKTRETEITSLTGFLTFYPPPITLTTPMSHKQSIVLKLMSFTY